MLSKKQTIFLICLGQCLSFEISATSLNEFSSELRRSIDPKKEFSLELSLLVLQQGYEVCTLVDKIDPKISSLLGVRCKECKKKIFSCAELAGTLLADGAMDKLNQFKKLLGNSDKKAVNQFMIQATNEQQVKCPECKKIVQWIELE